MAYPYSALYVSVSDVRKEHTVTVHNAHMAKRKIDRIIGASAAEREKLLPIKQSKIWKQLTRSRKTVFGVSSETAVWIRIRDLHIRDGDHKSHLIKFTHTFGVDDWEPSLSIDWKNLQWHPSMAWKWTQSLRGLCNVWVWVDSCYLSMTYERTTIYCLHPNIRQRTKANRNQENENSYFLPFMCTHFGLVYLFGNYVLHNERRCACENETWNCWERRTK